MLAARADSARLAATAAAPALRDDAQATLAALLPDPGRARFDSVVVVQPAPADSGARVPPMVVCGRLAGLPGHTSPARFIYQSRFTVFVEDARNHAQFTELWGRSCGTTGGEVLLGG
jgi:hypothetical protein